MIEQLISTDLAALAALDRQNVGPLVIPEATPEVRAGVVVPRQAVLAAAVVAASSAVGVQTLVPDDPMGAWLAGPIIIALAALAYLVTTRIVVRRDSAAAFASATGAAWAGSIAALVCAAGSWLAIQNPGTIFVSHTWNAYRYMQPVAIAQMLGAVILSAAAVGSTWRGPVGDSSPTRLALVEILGITSLLVTFGLMWSTCDHWTWRDLFSPVRLGVLHETWWQPQIVIVRWAVGGSLVGILCVTIPIGVACARERTRERARLLAVLEHGSMVPIAIALGLATLVLEHGFDTGHHTLPFDQQLVLAALGTSAVTLFVATVALRHRRRALEQTTEAVGSAKRSRWLTSTVLVVTFIIAGVLLEGDVRTFNEARQLAIAFVLAVMAMLGLAGSPPVRTSRPLGDVLAAAGFAVVVVVSSVIGWRQHMTDCLSFDGRGGTVGPCQEDPIVTTTTFVAVSWAAVLVIAAGVARLVRREGPRAWSIAAKIVVVTLLITWLGINQYMDRSLVLIDFQSPDPGMGTIMVAPHRAEVARGWLQLGDFVRAHSEAGQRTALEAGLALFGLALSIGVACLHERKRPSRWLALLESPVIIPLGVVVATASLFLAQEQWDLFQFHRGDPDDIPWWAAIASIGAVVAYASMLLRRRRREALS